MFDKEYPNLVSYVRVLEIGGLVWESDRPYRTVTEVRTDAEAAVAAWLDKH